MDEMQAIFIVVLAMLLGGSVGIEREFAGKPAGLRTHMLVSGAACLLVILGFVLTASFMNDTSNSLIQSDPVRIIEAIIVGVSFVGAGTIIQREEKERVANLTTAASVLMAAAIGIAVALEQFVLAIGVVMLVIFVNRVLIYLERWMRTKKRA